MRVRVYVQYLYMYAYKMMYVYLYILVLCRSGSKWKRGEEEDEWRAEVPVRNSWGIEFVGDFISVYCDLQQGAY